MALGDLKASRLPDSSLVAGASNGTNHYYKDCGGPIHDDVDLPFLERRDSETASCNYGGNGDCSTSLAYFPRTVLLREFRHEVFEDVHSGPANSCYISKWRKDRGMKTGCVALVLCLNISVDPPDVIKVSPCARLECWIDPFSMAPQKALETVGKNLIQQYERWQPRARYRVQLDPTVDEVKKLCNGCRRNAKSERVLFHYNGHGVPKPTADGKIWMFNKIYTEYIPLPIRDLDSWLGTPSIYVFDCSGAGMVLDAFLELHDEGASSSSGSSTRDCILLAACEAHEILPQSVEFPADVFTSCLTTPIKMALRWFCTRSLLHATLDYSLIDKIPGRQNDRRTLLGELNWILTSVTDTIAWNVLPRDLFQRLFRQDLLVATLFRNFLLAERIMRSSNCSPISHPMLPPTHQHHMWSAWDMAAEICLSQLPLLVEDPHAVFQPSPFFAEQLTAFEGWLDHGSEHKKPPEQLPIVLQALQNQYYQFRALVLLGRFVDMGAWAVDLALSVGIFPFVLKLLQAKHPEVRQILVFIWTKILALDKSCQDDIVKDGGHIYFISFLDSAEAYPEQRAMAAFVLAVIVDGYRRAQEACTEAGLIHVSLKHLKNPMLNDGQNEPLFVQWLCLCLGKLWEDFSEAQIIGLQASAPAIFATLLSEPQPEVRASVVFALGTLLDVVGDPLKEDAESYEEYDDDDEQIRGETSIVKNLLTGVSDGSPLVRTEATVALARFVFRHKQHLKSVAAAYCKSQPNSMLNSLSSLPHLRSIGTGYAVPHITIGPLTRVGIDNESVVRDKRISSSSPLTVPGLLHGSSLSNSPSQHSDSGILNDGISNAFVNHSKPKALYNAIYRQCVLAMCTLAQDPYPRIASLSQKVLSTIGIDQLVTRPSKSVSSIFRSSESTPALKPLAGHSRSSSWFDMTSGRLSSRLTSPPLSPPQSSNCTGIRRTCSLEFRPHMLNSADWGLADPLIGSEVPSGISERSLLAKSTIYTWSCGHFTKPLLTVTDDIEDLMAKREEKEKFARKHIAKCQHNSSSKLNNEVASWDTRFEMGTKAALMQPFSPIVVAADENEQIRVWNYEEPALLNSFDNHKMPEKGVSKLCLLNEFDESLLMVASFDGSIRIWKDYASRGEQKLVTAFCSIQGHKSDVRTRRNAVVDWQQQSCYLYASGETSSIMVWDLDKEQLVHSIPSSSECSLSALSASQVHGSQFTTGYMDGSIRLYDVRTPEMLVCETRPHTQKVERVVGVGFQPGLDPAKIISASQAGDIQLLDLRNNRDTYCTFTIEAHRGSLTALAVHRHAPIIASGSAKQLIKVFSLKGKQLGTIRYSSTFLAHTIGSISCLTFHPYKILLAAGASDSCLSIYADDKSQTR